jgi:hypothetical protein
MANQPPDRDDPGRVLPFRHRRSDEIAEPGHPLAPDHLAQYERDAEPDDYRHRMLMNGAALLVIAALVGAGLWLATTMAEMRKNQDCVLSGRRGCTPVDIPHQRW